MAKQPTPGIDYKPCIGFGFSFPASGVKGVETLPFTSELPLSL